MQLTSSSWLKNIRPTGTVIEKTDRNTCTQENILMSRRKRGGGQVFNEKKKQVTSIREGRKHGQINYKDTKP
jgi:hypothetical protein